jgi:hypothetical protein
VKKFLLSTLAVAAIALPSVSQAALNVQVPSNATLIFKGLEWAWASPLDQTTVDLSYQSQYGWRLPTAAELAFAPTGIQFIYAGANTPFGGSDPASGATWQYTNGQTGAAANAVRYFSNFSHLDFCNAPGSGCGFNNEPAWNVGAGFSESLAVRTPPGGVPEPAAWAMMLAGFGLVGSAMRRREKVAVTFA